MAAFLPLSLLLLLLLLPLSSSPAANPPTKSPPSHTLSPLDPDQVTALRSLNLPTKPDPCTANPTTLHCDSSSPFRHVTSLSLANCSSHLSLTSPLSSLPTLTSLSLSSCHLPTPHLPLSLSSHLFSLSLISSLDKHLTSVWLSHFSNLTSLTIVNSAITASGPGAIISKMENLETLTISGANLTGFIPKGWKNLNLTQIDLSNNRLKGRIPSSIANLESLSFFNLSKNELDGEIPSSIADMKYLTNISISFNSISGSLPEKLPEGLMYLDLGSNQLNGTIPHFISRMKSLKYLNLEKNNFEGVMPFNYSFIHNLDVFKIGENSNLCYNHSIFKNKNKIKLGIAPCDKHGLPLSPPPPKDDGGDDGSNDDYSSGNDQSDKKKKDNSHGPNKVVLGVAIGLSAVVFLIIFCVLISKCCR